jgi:beta-N-acetylhexosaminidase
VRGAKLYVPLVGVAVIAATVVTFAARADARHVTGSGHRASATTTSHSVSVGQRRERSASAPLAPAAVGLRPGVTSPSAAGLPAAVALLPKLTAIQLAGQRVIYSYTGLAPPASLLWLISHGEAAGVIFFTDNIGTTAQFAAAVSQLRRADASRTNPVHLPLLLMTDQEGGVVRRLPGPPVLSEKQVGQAAHPWTAATDAGAGAGSNLRGHGLNVNLAPVLDVYRQAGNFIDEFGRSFSSHPVKVAKLGALYATAEQQAKVAATVKHFPGLGAATRSQNTDQRPVTLSLSRSAIRSVDELPYRSAIAGHAKLVMVSWAIYPALDKKYPAGLSGAIIRGELRNRLGFGGVTITDALEAGALSPFGSIANRATIAARAGMDLLLCAGRKVAEGQTAMHALSSDYTGGTAAYQKAFKAAVARILALRKTLS